VAEKVMLWPEVAEVDTIFQNPLDLFLVPGARLRKQSDFSGAEP